MACESVTVESRESEELHGEDPKPGLLLGGAMMVYDPRLTEQKTLLGNIARNSSGTESVG